MGHGNTSCDPHLHQSHQATNAPLPHAKRLPQGGYVLTRLPPQRARVLRLRRTDCSLASGATQPWCLSPTRRESASWFSVFRSSIASPLILLSTLREGPRRASRKTRSQDRVAVSFLVGLLH